MDELINFLRDDTIVIESNEGVEGVFIFDQELSKKEMKLLHESGLE